MEKIEIVPGRSIGPITIGARREALPTEATISSGIGRLGRIHFSVVLDVVDDVWIDGLEDADLSAEIDGGCISNASSLEDIQKIVGTCTRLDSTLGGTFYNCQRGITLGFNIEGVLSQIRIKPR